MPKNVIDWCRLVLLIAGIVGITVLVFAWLRTGINAMVPNGAKLVDYVNVVVILLTTVTVLFTVAALALGALGIWGFKNIRSDAERAAEDAVSETLETAFEPGGKAYEEIREEIIDEDGALGNWLRNEIERKVTDQLAIHRASMAIDENDAEDEGEQE